MSLALATHALCRPATGVACAPLKSAIGPARLVETKGYTTTSAISTFRKVEAKAVLQRGTSELACMPESRVHQRLFGVEGPGRTKALSTGLHASLLGSEYDPRCDTCVRAFVRLFC